jgi:hypothetical protein
VLLRFVFVAGMAISVMVAVVISAAYVSVFVFRHDTAAEAETVALSGSPQAKSDVKSVSDLYVGSHIIIVCSELAGTQQGMSCP